MKSVKNKQLLVGADFAGFPLKEAVVAHLKKKGWEITDYGVTSLDQTDTDLMFHRVGLRVGAAITEKGIRPRTALLRHRYGYSYCCQQMPRRSRGRC